MKLPKELEISIQDLELDERICDYLSDTYGWCINGFDFDVKDNKIIVSNIDWDTTEG